MSGKQWKMGKRHPWLAALVGALIVEMVLCNLSAWKSLFYRERIVFERMSVEGASETETDRREYVVDYGEKTDETATSSVVTIHIPEVDRKIYNLQFHISFSEIVPIPYTISLTDEGNAYPYALPESVWMPGTERTFFANIYPAGKVGDITVQFTAPAGSVFWLEGIGANVRIPFAFYFTRFAAVLGVFLLLCAAGSRQARERVCESSLRQRLTTGAVILLLVGMAWKMAHVNPVCITSPWPHHKQYQELAEAMAKGQLFLDEEPSEGLLSAPNPYDTIYLQANGIGYRADSAYYEGKYYVYFGVVPELLLYLPCYLLTGRHLPNYLAVFLFYSGFIVAVFGLLREVIRRWFPETPYLLYLLASALTVCCGNYLFVIARPDLYDTPIMAANMFTVAGLALWIKGKNMAGGDLPASVQSGRISLWKRGLVYAAGSLCMALVAGCRPQMLLFSFLAVPLFWEEVIGRRELFSKKSIRETVMICLPYVLVAAGIMYYNAARFSSPFDFGATYSLTSNDMTKREFSLAQTGLGLWHYLFRPPVVTDDFPFIQGVQIASGSYMGKLNAEYTYSGMLAGNAFCWLLFGIGKVKERLKEKGLYPVAWASIIVSVLLCVVDVIGAGILQRYMVDMIWGLWFAALLVLLALSEHCLEKGKWKGLMVLFTVLCVLQAFYGLGVVFGNGDLSVNVRASNPYLYYAVKSMFQW